MKFSLIVPVYKVEDYIEKCLESIFLQTYDNYEVIIVNDGSPDNSEAVIKKYIKGKKKFKYFKKENGGLSDARNFGLNHVTGDYILFIDSDDYIDKDLLFNLNLEINKESVDIVKFNLRFIENNTKRVMKKTNINNLSVNEAIPLLLEDELLEPACIYCYKTSFWRIFDFKYAKGKIHEDYGLTPLIIMNAKNISSIEYVGYNYVIRENSISVNTKNELKKANDTLDFAIDNIKVIGDNKNINENCKSLLINFYTVGAIGKLKKLEDKENKKIYCNRLKKTKLYKYLLNNNWKRKIKKMICMCSYNIYIKLFMR